MVSYNYIHLQKLQICRTKTTKFNISNKLLTNTIRKPLVMLQAE